uniref:Vacuolar protein-sorting-associated protein 25 n=1 Tax=Ditylenchus dipsaci TaxID=166011 RepID=A0A915DEA9_9BILA
MSFQFPWQYDFAPFYTIQPNLATREKQLEAWCRIVIDFCQYNKIYSIDLDEIAKSELFNNTKLNRRLDTIGIRTVFDYLEQQKHVEWKDKTKRRCNIYWRRPEEWGQLIHEWASSCGLLNSIVTLYDLTQGEDTVDESFHGLDIDVLVKAIEYLESQKKAVFIEINVALDLPLGSTFIRNRDFIEEGDTVVIYLNHTALNVVVVQRGQTVNMRYGALRHEFLIGKRYGTQISATAGYVYALRPNPSLWTKTLNRRTQILYTPTLLPSFFCWMPNLGLLFSGTGSGSLTHAIAVAVAPNGHAYTHDIDESRVRIVEKELKDHGLSLCTTAVQQDVCEDGFFVKNACDGVFLDLPAPWKAVVHAKKAISRVRGGRIVGFSPCIEQVQQFCEELETHGFIQIQTIEIVPRKLKVIGIATETLAEISSKTSADDADTAPANGNEFPAGKKTKKRKVMCLAADSKEQRSECIAFPQQQPTHTGYLTSATLLSSELALLE